MKKVVLICGLAGCGKDTFADISIEYLESLGYKCCKMSFAHYLKRICRDFLGWDGQKDENGRHMLQYVGTDLIREKLGWNDFHVRRVVEDIKIVENEYDFVFIPDTRFDNEAYITIAEFGEKVMGVGIKRSDYKEQLQGERAKHRSENGLKLYTPENQLRNNRSREEFAEFVKGFWELKLGETNE